MAMEKMFLIFVFLLFQSNLVEIEALSLKTIFEDSSNALLSSNRTKVDRVLRKYYFTDDKAQSIWWIAENERHKMFKIAIGRKDFQGMQNGIEKLKMHYETCTTLEENEVKAQCFYKFNELIKRHRDDFFWNPGQGASKEGRAKYGTLFLSFSAMSSLLSFMTSSNLYLVDDRTVQQKWKSEMSSIIAKLSGLLFDYEKDIKSWRLDQISLVQLCEVKQNFWKKFKGVCEARWNMKRSQLLDNIKKELAKKDEVFPVSLHDDPILDAVDRIGGEDYSFRKLFNGEVKDHVENTVLFNEDVIIKLDESVGNILNSLNERGILKRDKYAKSMASKLDKFNNDTAKPLFHLLEVYHKSVSNL